MATNPALNPLAPVTREVPHTVSPGLWALAWKRLQSDHVGMVSLAIVAAFLPLAYALRGTWTYRRVILRGGSAAIAAIAAVWLVERALDMPLL